MSPANPWSGRTARRSKRAAQDRAAAAGIRQLLSVMVFPAERATVRAPATPEAILAGERLAALGMPAVALRQGPFPPVEQWTDVQRRPTVRAPAAAI